MNEKEFNLLKNIENEITYESATSYRNNCKKLNISLDNQINVNILKNVLNIKRKRNLKAMTMCGYKCDQCKAYVNNIKKKDQRENLSNVWKEFYELNIPNEKIICNGCRCVKKEAIRIDQSCPIRVCVINHQVNHCGDCQQFPCDKFSSRIGLCVEKAKDLKGENFDINIYQEYLMAFDNQTRLNNYLKVTKYLK